MSWNVMDFFEERQRRGMFFEGDHDAQKLNAFLEYLIREFKKGSQIKQKVAKFSIYVYSRDIYILNELLLKLKSIQNDNY